MLDGELSFTYTVFMSTQKLTKVIESELERLNETIDIKIIQGQPYKKEARQHKFLLTQFAILKRSMNARTERGMFSSFSHAVSSFLL